MRAFHDLTGKRFTRLLAIEHERRMIKSSRGMSPAIFWKCKCDCGKVVYVRTYCLESGNTKSCGCFNADQKRTPKTHGMSKSITYSRWQHMKQRCSDSNYRNFDYWGGRGIKVCDSWKKSFDSFYADMGECPSPNHSLDRINNDGNYEPANCRWALRFEQSRNTRRNRLITIGSETKSLVEWSEQSGVKSRTIRCRIDTLGWSEEDAVFTPVN